MKQFKGTPGEWIIRTMPDGSPFIEAPKVLPTAGYNIEVFGAEDANYPEAMRRADFMLGAAAKDLLQAALNFCEKVETGRAKSVESYQEFKAAIEKALQEPPIAVAPGLNDFKELI
jgi:hypothetical protein